MIWWVNLLLKIWNISVDLLILSDNFWQIILILRVNYTTFYWWKVMCQICVRNLLYLLGKLQLWFNWGQNWDGSLTLLKHRWLMLTQYPCLISKVVWDTAALVEYLRIYFLYPGGTTDRILKLYFLSWASQAFQKMRLSSNGLSQYVIILTLHSIKLW